jgi:hypothetical protein
MWVMFEHILFVKPYSRAMFILLGSQVSTEHLFSTHKKQRRATLFLFSAASYYREVELVEPKKRY